MKRVTIIALALVLSCFTCAEIKSPQTTNTGVAPATAAEVIQKAARSSIQPKEIMIAETKLQGTTPKEVTTAEMEAPDIIPEESSASESEVVYEQVATTQTEDAPEEIVHAKTGGADDISVIIEHAKTGYGDEEPEILSQPIPEPETSADVQAAIDTACAYAANTYGVIIDTSLGFDNSAYRFPAVVPDTASQETLNAKAIGMVDYTFQQQMVLNRVTVEQVRDAEFHCNVAIVAENGEWYTYVFYTG